MNELKEKIFSRLLTRVTKPSRYLGMEHNIVVKNHDAAVVKVALAFPDVYEVGMSYLGFKILYEIINNRTDSLAERVFAPWKDMEKLMRAENVPLYTLETYTPLCEFDIIGFTLQYEMSYTNILLMLDLAGLPLKASERTTGPLVIAGGPCADNPEPLAEFIDLFVIGEGEEVIDEIIDVFRKNRSRDRKSMLLEMAKIQGIYVPGFYRSEYNSDGTLKSLKPTEQGVPEKILKRRPVDLEKAYFPVKPVVPFMNIVHDRLTLEIIRGCMRGCRFCQAGMIYRPFRERSIETLVKSAIQVYRNTGYDEISLSSLSSSDYSHLGELVRRFTEHFGSEFVSISMSSLRTQTFSVELAGMLQSVRKTGLTFAPEAGSSRLRHVINKDITDQDVVSTASAAWESGWKQIKFYFVVGFPTETDEDVAEIHDLVRGILRCGKEKTGRAVNVSVSLAFFIPKPHTPFQWRAQDDPETLMRRLSMLRKKFSYSLKWHQPELSRLEAVFARGDRRLSQVLLQAFRLGCTFDGWSEIFNYGLWEEAFRKSNMNPAWYANRKRQYDEVLPWDHIDIGVEKKFLQEEDARAEKGTVTPDCRSECRNCGIRESFSGINCPRPTPAEEIKNRRAGRSSLLQPVQRIRVKFAKEGGMEFISHLELLATIQRAFRRSGLALAYSGGFNPRPRISFGFALPVGTVSKTEYLDAEFVRRIDVKDVSNALEKELPSGLRVLECTKVPLQDEALTNLIRIADYEIRCPVNLFSAPASAPSIRETLEKFLKQDSITAEHWSKKGLCKIEIRDLIRNFEFSGIENGDLILHLSIWLSNTRNVKPREVLSAFGIKDLFLCKIVRTKLTTEQGQELLYYTAV